MSFKRILLVLGHTIQGYLVGIHIWIIEHQHWPCGIYLYVFPLHHDLFTILPDMDIHPPRSRTRSIGIGCNSVNTETDEQVFLQVGDVQSAVIVEGASRLQQVVAVIVVCHNLSCPKR